jgi:uncharacterized membrane protein HdeD (DUF308 family)
MRSQNKLCCAHCGQRLSYNALPRRFLIALAAIFLFSGILPFIIPVASPVAKFQPTIVVGLVILAFGICLKNWPVYRVRD